MSDRPRRDPESLRHVLDAVTRDLEGASTDVITTIVHAWPELVGPQLAAVAQPGSLVDGTLTVVVDDAAAATALRHQAGALRERLASRCGPDVVRALRVRVRRRGASGRGS